MKLFFLYMMVMSLISLVLVRKHIFMCILNLEFFVLYIMLYILMVFLFYDNCLYMYVMFMVFYVCEGSLGLSLIVYVIRFHSNDYLSSMVLW